jgi:hypothetical protein
LIEICPSRQDPSEWSLVEIERRTRARGGDHSSARRRREQRYHCEPLELP